MAIDARIAGVTILAPTCCDTCNMIGKDPASTWDDCPACHGATHDKPQVHLHLEPRNATALAGQRILRIMNPPHTHAATWSALIGLEIWGSACTIMVGHRQWAKRVGYTGIELILQDLNEGEGDEQAN
jgi:hypothetical protein